jgi:enamine deaminase RidA (YjgF/YER057c/UK114 family)
LTSRSTSQNHDARTFWPARNVKNLLSEREDMIRRIDSNARLAQALIHNNIVYTSGQVGALGESAAAQTTAILSSIDKLLAAAGTDKTKIIQAIIWLADIEDFDEMNIVWDKWVDPDSPPARATGEVRLSDPAIKVEIIVTAAV